MGPGDMRHHMSTVQWSDSENREPTQEAIARSNLDPRW